MQRDLAKSTFSTGISTTSTSALGSSTKAFWPGIGTYVYTSPSTDLFSFMQADLYLYADEIVIGMGFSYYTLTGSEILGFTGELKPLGKTLYQLLKDINKGIVNGKT